VRRRLSKVKVRQGPASVFCNGTLASVLDMRAAGARIAPAGIQGVPFHGQDPVDFAKKEIRGPESPHARRTTSRRAKKSVMKQIQLKLIYWWEVFLLRMFVMIAAVKRFDSLPLEAGGPTGTASYLLITATMKANLVAVIALIALCHGNLAIVVIPPSHNYELSSTTC
jgi:hypothetical protein